MSIRRLSYAACDCCGNPAECADDAREARRVAAAAGWARRGGLDLCRRCAAEGHPVCDFGRDFTPQLVG